MTKRSVLELLVLPKLISRKNMNDRKFLIPKMDKIKTCSISKERESSVIADYLENFKLVQKLKKILLFKHSRFGALNDSYL